MQIPLPAYSLVVLIGPSGVGKSTFARRHFRPTEILSSDFFRALVSDDENDQSVSKDAFDILHMAVGRRLAHRRLSVVDATNVEPHARQNLLAIAEKHHCPAVAIVFALPEALAQQRNQGRVGRTVEPHVVSWHAQRLELSLPGLHEEGFARIHVLTSPEEMEAVVFVREPLPFDRRGETGPLDLIGDVHGCFDELQALLASLGYQLTRTPGGAWEAFHPQGRKVVFVGDLVDRGPKVAEVLRLAMSLVATGRGYCVIGNHDDKLLRHLRGRPVKVGHGLAETLEQLKAEPEGFTLEVRDFLGGLPFQLLLDGGRLVVAHAGLPQEMHGRDSRRARDFALYGDVSGQTDENGFPVRGDWGARYTGHARVVYGHTPVDEPTWVNGTLNIDTGCVFGSRLTALRYPEMELTSVPAQATYWQRGGGGGEDQ